MTHESHFNGDTLTLTSPHGQLVLSQGQCASIVIMAEKHGPVGCVREAHAAAEKSAEVVCSFCGGTAEECQHRRCYGFVNGQRKLAPVAADKPAPCGGNRCYKTDLGWTHSSKSYDSCCVNRGEPTDRPAGDDAATASGVINEIIEQQYIDGGSTLDQANAVIAAIRRGEVPGIRDIGGEDWGSRMEQAKAWEAVFDAAMLNGFRAEAGSHGCTATLVCAWIADLRAKLAAYELAARQNAQCATDERDRLSARVVELERERDAYTYKSGQATNCAVCGKLKHTPLRRDHMGGYVCLTCIDAEMDKALACVAELERDADPPVCRLQLPDGRVPVNARAAAEAWHAVADKALADLAAERSSMEAQRASNERARKRYDHAHPEDAGKWPDRTDMVLWLMAEYDAIAKECLVVKADLAAMTERGKEQHAWHLGNAAELVAERDAARAEADALRAENAEAYAANARLEAQAQQVEAERDALKATVASLVEHAPPGHPLHSCGGPQEACMQPGCTECGCPTMEQALALRKDATRWRGLIASQRIRPLGCAGLGDDTENDLYAHLGLEIWTIHPGEHDNRIGIDWLTKYADKAASAAGVAPC